MRKTIIAALLALFVLPGLGQADPWKDKGGKGRDKDYWKHRDDWSKDQRKREEKYWKAQREADKRAWEWQRDQRYRVPDYEARRPIYPPAPWYPAPTPQYDPSIPYDGDGYPADGYPSHAHGRIGPHQFEIWW